MADAPGNESRRLELCELAERYMQDDLDAAGLDRLNRILASDPAMRAEFVALCADAQLLGQSLAQRGLEDRLGAKMARLVEGAPATARPAAARPARAGYVGPILAVAAALLVFAGVVAVYVLVVEPSAGPDEPGPPIATLIDASDVVIVNEDIANPGAEVAAGLYSIESGAAEFLLTNRVTARIQGQTRLHMRSPRDAYLEIGSSSFTVPRGVEGFTVHLPDQTRIVDLGTAFEVEVDEAGHARLRVTEGAVAWITPGAADAEAQRVTVKAGQSAVLADGTPVIVELPRQGLVLIGPDTRNGSFELVDGSPSDAVVKHWDTAPEGDIDHWTLWREAATASNDSGTYVPRNGGASHGRRVAFLQSGNAVYNLTDHVISEGDVFTYSFDHVRDGRPDTTIRLVYDDGRSITPISGSGVKGGPIATHTQSFVIRRGHVAIGKRIGIALSPNGSDYPEIDNVVLRVARPTDAEPNDSPDETNAPSLPSSPATGQTRKETRDERNDQEDEDRNDGDVDRVRHGDPRGGVDGPDRSDDA